MSHGRMVCVFILGFEIQYGFPFLRKGGKQMQFFVRIKDQEVPVTDTVYALLPGERKERYRWKQSMSAASFSEDQTLMVDQDGNTADLI